MEKKMQKLTLPTENETGRKTRSKQVGTNSHFRKAHRNEAAGVLFLSQSQGPEEKKWGMAERGRGYVAPLHQHVCSNAIAGFHRTKKTRAIQHAHPVSPGVWTQLCSNYHAKPALNRALFTKGEGTVLFSLQLGCVESSQLHSRCV